MFQDTLSVELSCPTHPEFTPAAESPTKRCRYCQAIANVYEWLRMARRTADRILDGAYGGEVAEQAPEVPLEASVDVVDAPDPVEQSSSTGKKRAISTMIEKAPEILTSNGPSRVRRKL